MDNSLQVFSSEDFGSIRALTIDNQPWFVAKDQRYFVGRYCHGRKE